MPESPSKNLRHLPDRRQRPTSPLSLYALIGRRQGPRRSDECWKNYYADRYPPFILGVIIAVLSLCILDAVFTLHLIKLGAQEANPVMRHFLSHGPAVFLIVKYTLTCGALILLLIHKNFRLLGGRLRSDVIFLMILALYILVIVYELILLFRL